MAKKNTAAPPAPEPVKPTVERQITFPRATYTDVRTLNVHRSGEKDETIHGTLVMLSELGLQQYANGQRAKATEPDTHKPPIQRRVTFSRETYENARAVNTQRSADAGKDETIHDTLVMLVQLGLQQYENGQRLNETN